MCCGFIREANMRYLVYPEWKMRSIRECASLLWWTDSLVRNISEHFRFPSELEVAVERNHCHVINRCESMFFYVASRARFPRGSRTDRLDPSENWSRTQKPHLHCRAEWLLLPHQPCELGLFSHCMLLNPNENIYIKSFLTYWMSLLKGNKIKATRDSFVWEARNK